MIHGIHPIITFIISMALFVFVSSMALAQNTERPFECVADADNLRLITYYPSFSAAAIDNEHWQELLQLEGDDKWIGYPQGWDVEEDVRREGKIYGDVDGHPIEVWIWGSELADVYYIFPFSNTLLFADANGDYWGKHPCGGWQVSRSILNALIIEIINNHAEWGEE